MSPTVKVSTGERRAQAQPVTGESAPGADDIVLSAQHVSFFYGDVQALSDISLDVHRNEITALIGPSGCGKTTFLRCLNRLNDMVPRTRLEGRVLFDGEDLYDSSVRPIDIRRRVGMVFQRANPFPKSIYENVAIAPRANGLKGNLDDLVEESLRRAALWDEVKGKLKSSAFDLSGGQQQRLCIARAIAVKPEVLLMDEPASALDPVATQAIEDLMEDLKRDYTIVIVTHNMQQAARVSDRTAFFTVDQRREGRVGVLVEYDDTNTIFTNPKDSRTEDYVTGRFG
ncbi:MAG TPA: phosphate ABC transporter ATP-binding protein PstB [Propionibacteriaceae bacterium]|nr:phosphate ABC transporter ATP-binding protein PstB [Propionibacteriaceae bacterium]